MSKVLKIATASAGALVLTASLAAAQTTPAPGASTGKTTTGQSTTHKTKGKKTGTKKGGKKKSGKKTSTTAPK